MQKTKKDRLALWIFTSVILALIFAYFFPVAASGLEIGGKLFLRLLTMVVVPLVVTSVMAGVIGLGDLRRLSVPGACTLGYYLMTTLFAIVIGLVLVMTIKPGVHSDKAAIEGVVEQGTELHNDTNSTEPVTPEADTDPAQPVPPETDTDPVQPVTPEADTDPVQPVPLETDVDPAPADAAEEKSPDAESADEEKTGPTKVVKGLTKEQMESTPDTIIQNLLFMLFTDNLFHSAAEGDLLPLIVFAILFGGILTMMGPRSETLRRMILELNDAMMILVGLLMKIAPFGIFCLVAAEFGNAMSDEKFSQMMSLLGWYFTTVLAGLLIHAFIILPAIYAIFTRKNPFRFVYHMFEAILTAFSTASSSATLPVTMRCITENAGVSKQSTEFVLPLGATINMDGTALYEAVAAVFIAQLLGFELGLGDTILIAVTATLASIGAAGIPQAGLVTMVIVLKAVDLPIEYVSAILPVDWLLDRFRTAVNVFGDSTGAAVVDQTFPPEEELVETASDPAEA